MVNGGLGLIVVMRGCIHSRRFFPSALRPSAPPPWPPFALCVCTDRR